MRFFRDLPIKRKLTAIIMATTVLALAVASAVFAIYDQVGLRRDLVEHLATTAQMFGFNSASALSFNDPGSAQQTLQGLGAQPHMLRACLYTRSGEVFATYRRDGADASAFPARPSESSEQFTRDTLELFRQVDLAGEEIGAIYLQSDLGEIRERLGRYALLLAFVTVGVGLLAYVVASRLQRLISEPVSQLAIVAGRVTQENDYAVRAEKRGDDELGRLIDAFNTMLGHIQTRDRALRDAHVRLEDRVQERTRALQAEIGERRRSELALQESHQRFELVARATADVIWDRDMRTGAVWRNENFQSVFGYWPGEVDRTEAGWSGCVHPDDLPAALASLHEVLVSGGLLWSSEYRFRRRDGTYACILDRGYVIRDDAGRSLRMIGAMQDITTLKAAQAEAAREQARLKFIFDAVPVGISFRFTRPDGTRSRLINDAHLRICGITREQADEPDIFQRISHPDDYARQLPLIHRLETRQIDRFSIEKRYLKPNQEIAWAVHSMQRRDYPDGSYEELATVVDISDLKRAQEETVRQQQRFKFIFDAVPVGFAWMVNGDPATRMVNPAHAAITGVPAGLAHELERYRDAAHPEDRAREEALHRALEAGDIDFYELEKRFVHADGSTRWSALTVRIYRGRADGETQEIATVVDITERKQAEVELDRAHQQLIETSRQAGMAEVATGVLHNVGNVLNSVNVSATLVADHVRQSKAAMIGKAAALLEANAATLAAFFTTDPRGRQLPGYLRSLADHLASEQAATLQELEGLRKNIEHIKDIVAMQQSYARVSGIADTVAIEDLVEDALRMNASALIRHEVQLVRDYQLRATVTLEKHKVLQILVNLIRNAKYACDESGRADKRIIVRIAGAADGLEVAVIDNGVGIPAENLTRIFGHGFTTRRDGHGFGLHSGAIAARELGGTLSVHSAGPGHGATFTLTLPRPSTAPTS